MVEVMFSGLSGLLFHNAFQMQSSCLKDSGEVCMFDGVSGAGIAYPSGAPEFSGVRVTGSLVLCVCFVDRCLSLSTFSFSNCVVCSSSIYGF